MKQFYSLFFLIFSLFFIPAFGQTGKDGTLTVTALNTVVNGYAPVPSNITAGVNTLTIGAYNSNGNPAITAGDLVLIVQVQGAAIQTDAATAGYGAITDLGNVGLYEIKRVAAVNGSILTFVSNIINNYTSTTATGPGNNARTQVVRLPRYSALTINAGASIVATPWNGSIGGIVAMEVTGTSTINGSINVSGQGFRGGVVEQVSVSPSNLPNYAYTTDVNGAAKGESVAGSTSFSSTGSTLAITGTLPGGAIFGRGAPANGGGGGGTHNAGGGGGANANNGNVWNGQGVMCSTCQGANAWALDPGYAANNNTRTNNSGGGRGGYNYSANNADATVSGSGNTAWGGDNRQERGGLGGRPFSTTVNQPQSRIFMGGGGGAGDSNNNTGTSGANGGGLVFLFSNALVGNGSIQANGNTAANTTGGGNDAPGGGGGGGTIVVKTTSNNTVSLIANGGNGGNQIIGSAEAEGPGGGGGAGYIAYSGGVPGLSVAGGTNGTTSSPSLTEFPTNGATSGSAGQTTDISNPNLAITSTDITFTQAISSPGPYFVGQQVTITLTATNISSSAATNAVVTDLLPGGLTFVSSSSPNYNATTGKWNIGGLAANNGTTSITITAIIAANTANTANFYTNTGTLNSYEYDVNQANNTNTLTLTPVNQPPVIISNGGGATGAISIVENITAVTTVQVTDPEANTITYALTGADASKFIISSTGTLTFQNAPNFELPTDADGNNVYDVVVRATDNGTGALFDEQALAITITNANEPPTAPVDNNAAVNTIPENVPGGTLVGITANSTDPDANTLTYSFATNGNPGGRFVIDPATGVVSVATGAVIDFELTPTLTVSVQASDGGLTSTQTTFTITVTNVNEPPTTPVDNNATANSVAENTTTGTPVGITARSTDPEGVAIVYSLTDDAGGRFAINSSSGVVTVANGNLIDFETANFHNITAQAADAATGALISTQTFTIAVTNVNEAPVITSNGGGDNAAVSVPENTSAVTTITSSDTDAGSTRTYAIVGGADASFFSISGTSNLVFTTAPDFEAPRSNIYTIIVRATDNGGLSDNQTITVTVTNANDPPTTPVDNNAAANTIPENSPNGTLVNITARSTDPDAGSTITYSLTDNSGGRFAIDPTSGVVTVANGTLLNFETATSHNITVQASDGTAASTQVFTINLSNINEFAPVIYSNGGGTAATIAVPENSLSVTTVAATDADANTTLTYSITGGADAAKFTINATTGSLSFINAPDFELPTDADGNNSYLVNVQVSDATTGGFLDNQNLTVNVTNVTTAPVATDNIARNKPTVVSSIENTNLSGSKAVDGGTTGDSRWSSAFSDPQWIYVDLGAVYNVTQINLLWEVAYGRNYQLQISNDATTWTTLQTVTNNTTAGSYLNYPGLSGSGRYVRMYGTVRGTGYGYSLYEFEVFGLPVNTAPTITSNGRGNTAALTLAENTTLVTKVTAADDEANPITYSIVGGADASKFKIDQNTGDLTFNTAPDFELPNDAGNNNVYDVIVRAADNVTPTSYDDQAIAITITNANDAPVAVSIINSTTLLNTAPATLINSLIGTDPDGNNTIAYFQITSSPSGGVLTINNVPITLNTNYVWSQASNLQFDPDISNTADATFNYIIVDNGGATSQTATYTIPINGEPVANNQTNNTAIPNTAGRTLLDPLNGTDPDPSGSITTFRFSVLPDNIYGIVYVNNIPANTTTNYTWADFNKVQFDPAYNHATNVTFTYVVRDNEGADDATPNTATAAVFTIPIQAFDQDGDGIADVNDQDDDNDGIPDTLESIVNNNGVDPSADNDSDDIPNYRDSTPGGGIAWADVNGDNINDIFDKDGDGIINSFDLDSDGDGITDVVEQAPNGLEPSNYSSSSGRLTYPVNTNGIPSGSTTTTLQSLNDFDGDGLFNFLDIDADNDGLRDYLEAQATPGPAVRTPSGADNDKDGIDNTFDATCGNCLNGNGTPQYPVISGVLNSRPDYLDENSDDDLFGDAIEAFDSSDPTKAPGYSLLDLKDLAAKFQAAATAAGNVTAAEFYNNSADSDNDGIPNWLEDADSDQRLNHVDPQSIFYHDSDNDGWVDLFDPDSYGTMPTINYAFRSNTNQIPLPAELIVFAAKPEKEGVQLNWETASETNNAYYEVERSYDGVTFKSIGRVKGAGTTTQLSRYFFLDKQPLNGTGYYRLKMVNVKEKFRHSGIIAVKHALISQAQLKTYPNPTTGTFTLEIHTLEAEELEVVITDITGQVIQTKKIAPNLGLNSSTFNLTDVRTGTYLIIVRGATIYLVDRIVKF